MERDDLIVNDQYSLDAHHSEEDGKKIRKTIWFVTALLTAITLVEVLMGVFIKRTAGETTWELVKWGFIVLTLIKAGYIVLSFMHLGDERKNLRNAVLVPYGIFIIYLIFIGLYEGSSTKEYRSPDAPMESTE